MLRQGCCIMLLKMYITSEFSHKNRAGPKYCNKVDLQEQDWAPGVLKGVKLMFLVQYKLSSKWQHLWNKWKKYNVFNAKDPKLICLLPSVLYFHSYGWPILTAWESVIIKQKEFAKDTLKGFTLYHYCTETEQLTKLLSKIKSWLSFKFILFLTSI